MKRLLPILLLVLIFLIIPFRVDAQIDSLGIAIPTDIQSENVSDGHIVCTQDGGVALCSSAYDPSMLGVVAAAPALTFRHDDDESLPLVLSSGNTVVQVTSAGGNIAVGDLLTTSEIPGVGQKATLNGYVLGTALEPYESEDPEAIGDVYASINIHPVTSAITSRSNIVGSLRQALSAPALSPVATFRYLLAFLVALISFGLGFFYFGRVINSGVEAIGRNPLAKGAIQTAVLLNILITLVIVFTGLGISLLILIL